MISKSLSKLWLIRETFKQAKNSVEIKAGDIVDPLAYGSLSLPLKAKATLFRKQGYRIAEGKPSLFRILAPIAPPENRLLLQRELAACESLGSTKDHKRIVLYRSQPDSALMREIGRLREEVFRLIGEGSGNSSDIDRYDPYYVHIVLWDEEDLEIVGAYRLCPTRGALNTAGFNNLYTQTLFDYLPEAKKILNSGLELGRSFVQQKYWGSRSLEYLWYGIAAFLRRHPQYRYLLGAVSISNSFSRPAKDLIVHYYQTYYGAPQTTVSCKRPYVIDESSRKRIDPLFHGLDAKAAFVLIKEQLNQLGYSVPALYKQYTELCNPGGSIFLGFNIDPNFNNCVDGLVVVDIKEISVSKKKRYGLTEHVVIDSEE